MLTIPPMTLCSFLPGQEEVLQAAFQLSVVWGADGHFLGSSGHSCRSNLYRKYSSAPIGSSRKVVGVKNFMWHLAHDAMDGTLSAYCKMTKQRFAMTKPCLNYRLVGTLQSVIFVTIQIDVRRDRSFKQSLTKTQVSRIDRG
jgi:hypothetical protein